MKRIVTLLLAAGLVLGAAAGSQAADIKAKGIWQNNLSWANHAATADQDADFFRASTRLRTQIDVIASESLKGVVFFEIGHQNWGDSKSGAALGNDGKDVKVRYSYVDWVIPQSPYGSPALRCSDLRRADGRARHRRCRYHRFRSVHRKRGCRPLLAASLQQL